MFGDIFSAEINRNRDEGTGTLSSTATNRFPHGLSITFTIICSRHVTLLWDTNMAAIKLYKK